MYISDQTIDRVKEAIDIAGLVGDYLDLKPAGRSLKACCPFHQEKTPSFMVTPDLGRYKCFGCGESGDGITFVMKMEHLDFPDAVRFLADKYGIPIEAADPREVERQEKKEALFRINREAALFYYRRLLTNRRPQAYLGRRGMTSAIINPFLLGYADGQGQSLYTFLKGKGAEDADLLSLGLIARSNSGQGFYDKFRNRLIFPIFNNQRKIVGFGGRVMGDGIPKYLNSPESEVFHKGRNLYGIHTVMERPHRDRIIMVEGYMDVIGLYGQGIDYALASLGTALTPDQARLIKRYTDQVYLCYDGDSAGIKAARRAIGVFRKEGIVPKMILLPDGLDPDEYIQAKGKEAFEEAIRQAVDPPSFEIKIIKAGHNMEEPSGRMDFLRQALDYLAGLDSRGVQDIYLREVADLAGVKPESVESDLDEAVKKKEALEEEARARKARVIGPDPFDPGDEAYDDEPEYYEEMDPLYEDGAPPYSEEGMDRAPAQASDEIRDLRIRSRLEEALLFRLQAGPLEEEKLALLMDYLSPGLERTLAETMVALRSEGISPSAQALKESLGEALPDVFYMKLVSREKMDRVSAHERAALDKELFQRVGLARLNENRRKLEGEIRRVTREGGGQEISVLFEELHEIDRKMMQMKEGDDL